jgi:hypothetical protein
VSWIVEPRTTEEFGSNHDKFGAGIPVKLLLHFNITGQPIFMLKIDGLIVTELIPKKIKSLMTLECVNQKYFTS